MSADNGIYILSSPVTAGTKVFEFRVAECQAIENLDYFEQGDERAKAFEVLLFGRSQVFDKENDAILYAHMLEKEIGTREFSVLEYGVSILPPREFPFPLISKEKANEILDEDLKKK
jgi:hypothetical protein